MKRYLALIVCFIFLTCAGSAWSYTVTIGVTNVNVGDVDQFLWAANGVNSSDASELQWVNDTLHMLTLLPADQNYTMDDWDKDEAMAGDWLLATGQTDIYAREFDNFEPMYFYLKLGGGNNAYEHILYRNDPELDWGVIKLAINESSPFTFTIKNIGSISHVGEVGTSVSYGPEPGALLLLGVGLIGLAGLRKMF